MKFIVTAGGQGTKIWPFSRKEKPKQFQRIFGNESLFTKNINMLLKGYPAEDIFISAKHAYLQFVKEQAPEIPDENIILEPDAPQGRGPGEGFAFLMLSLKCPDDPFMLIQSDFLYLPNRKLLDTVAAMEKVVREHKKYMSGGIRPQFPVLGVDYLDLGELVCEESPASFYAIDRLVYRTKDYEKTKDLIERSDVVIHTNIGCWFPEMMLDAYKQYKPDWYEALMQIKDIFGSPNEKEGIEKIYSTMEPGATELVTQHLFDSGEALCVVYPFKAVDIGTWDSVYQFVTQGNGVHTEGNVIALESSGTLIKSINKNKLVAVWGLKDMIVVDTDDILFIAPRDKAAKVKDIQKELEDKNMSEYL